MEYPSTETMNLALNIIDRHGRLKREYTNHPARRGLGIWQDELSEGDFLIIETATVLKKARRQGIGRQLVMDMIQKATKLDTNVRFVFAYPSCLHMAEDLQERTGKTKKERFGMADARTALAIRFFRQLGFHRIGISHWFALSIDINHLSRTISIADDPEPPEVEPILYDEHDSDDPQPEVPEARSVVIGEPLGTDRDFNYNEAKSSRQEVADHLQEKVNRRRARSEYAQLYPIHHALQSLPDSQCIAMLKERALKGDESQGSLIESKDCYKNNILHIAACNFKPVCVEWILKSIAVNHPDLKNGRKYSWVHPS
ncbi:hypothetical protein BO83DRAFT_95840 [Aspergillus eucalypticola CBS 122712]|uniref:N-acetyltransferase domain-containing protein n=1 Tax=Aspergillus eucalypticola (strain CBS 122712 / IBT 29274) TaxID=1448314 RepID=A0A317V394_ASPEC|nr:uncharacterized protein BO83DRAFT_95840 [Aspergillus eucalypticola CBS 122712]PWY67811.1 hypothetical protein BO83DRAFT_95840 [Aspergillus eucalypticola CBS 122712]